MPGPITAKKQRSAEKRSVSAFQRFSVSAFLLPSLCLYWLFLIYQLSIQWSLYEQYNYGWAVPFLCAYLIWNRTEKTQSKKQKTENGEGGKRPFLLSAFYFLLSKKSLSYVFLISVLLLYAATRFVHEANPVWRLTSWLWSLEVLALTFLVLNHAARSTHHASRIIPLFSLLVPLFFFLVAVPWPYPVEQYFVQTLTQLNASSTVELLRLFGIPAAQHGNVIEISTGSVGIDEACSGIRSLQATLMLALFFGELYLLTPMRRLLCVLAAFAFSFLFNLGRTLVLSSVASAQGTGGISRWHDPAGVTILLTCFITLWLLARALGKKRAERSEEEEQTPTYASHPLEPIRPIRTFSVSAFQRFSFFLLIWFLFVELGTQLWYRAHENSTLPNLNWTVRIPENGGAYKTNEVAKLVTDQFKQDQGTELHWDDSNGAHWQLFYFRWVPAHSLARRVRVQRAKMHGPATCLTHMGMTLKADLGPTIIRFGKAESKKQKAESQASPQIDVPQSGDSFPLAFHQYTFESEGRLLHVFFGIYEDQTGSGVLANRRIGAAARIKAALSGSRNYGQRFLELAVSGYDSSEDARLALTRELSKIVQVEKPEGRKPAETSGVDNGH